MCLFIYIMTSLLLDNILLIFEHFIDYFDWWMSYGFVQPFFFLLFFSISSSLFLPFEPHWNWNCIAQNSDFRSRLIFDLPIVFVHTQQLFFSQHRFCLLIFDTCATSTAFIKADEMSKFDRTLLCFWILLIFFRRNKWCFFVCAVFRLSVIYVARIRRKKPIMKTANIKIEPAR